MADDDAVPAAIRAIFAQWSEACDPAPLGPGDDPAALAAFYRRLAYAAAGTHLARHELARIHADAARNCEAGQFAELRREGQALLPWIEQMLAADVGSEPAPHDRVPRQ